MEEETKSILESTDDSDYILESSKYKKDKKRKKRYKCPFCDYHDTKQGLASHVDEKHEDMIPEGYTAARVVFNHIYHKTHGVCVVCKRETEWDEEKGKYKRLCGRKECYKALRDSYRKNMIKVYGKDTLLNDPEQQEKMLKNRRISGKYRFHDGGYHIYTGTYEMKCMEFLDKALNYESTDILAPGPVIEYEFNGKKLKWITDIFIIPYNLIIEIKDGGSNPNKRSMPEYRAKQVAKEKMLTNMGTYNYLRLTNNNFEQLIEILMELKSQMIDDTTENKKAIINIHEEVNWLREAVGLNFIHEGNMIDGDPTINTTTLRTTEKYYAYNDRDFLNIANSPEQLNGVLNTSFRYGFTDGKGRILKDGDPNYHVQTPYRFSVTKVGSCWDFTTFEYYWFKKYYPEANVKAWYIEINDREECPTHTWVTYTDPNTHMTMMFESAWRANKGIYPFPSEMSMIKDYGKRFIYSYNHKTRKKYDPIQDKLFVVNFVPSENLTLNCYDYMIYVLNHSRWYMGDNQSLQWYKMKDFNKMLGDY